jgi:hypothetical protein
MSRRELVTFTRQQLLALLAEVNGILGGEFPYEHSRDALKELKKKLVECGDQLDTAERSSDLALIESTCSTVAEEIQWSIGYVGFFLRSTNVRNAFEAWGPLLRLARRLLRLNSKLVISSEWEFSRLLLSAYPLFLILSLSVFPHLSRRTHFFSQSRVMNLVTMCGQTKNLPTNINP